jgi:hypothetical protein
VLEYIDKAVNKGWAGHSNLLLTHYYFCPRLGHVIIASSSPQELTCEALAVSSFKAWKGSHGRLDFFPGNVHIERGHAFRWLLKPVKQLLLEGSVPLIELEGGRRSSAKYPLKM